VCGYNSAPAWLRSYSYDVMCPKCKTQLLIYTVNDEIYLREKPTYF